jgi:hypothetical protein
VPRYLTRCELALQIPWHSVRQPAGSDPRLHSAWPLRRNRAGTERGSGVQTSSGDHTQRGVESSVPPGYNSGKEVMSEKETRGKGRSSGLSALAEGRVGYVYEEYRGWERATL